MAKVFVKMLHTPYANKDHVRNLCSAHSLHCHSPQYPALSRTKHTSSMILIGHAPEKPFPSLANHIRCNHSSSKMTKSSKASPGATGATIKEVTTLLSKAQPFLQPAQEILSLTSTAVKDLQKPANKSKAKKAKVVIELAKKATAVASEASTKHKKQKALLKKDVGEDEMPLLQERLEDRQYYDAQPGDYYYEERYGGEQRGGKERR
jgi:hypothetical protein